MSPLFQNTPLKGFRERGTAGPQPGAAARRAPRHRAFAQMRVPEQSHPDSPTNFASCPPARDRLGKEAQRLSSAHHTRRGLGRCVPTPGWEDAVDGHKSVWGLVRGREGRAHVHTLTRAHTRAHAHARRGPLAAAPILRQGREAVTRATSAAVTSPEHHAGPGLRRARARLLRAAGCAAIGRGVCAATLSPAARRRGRPAGWGRAGGGAGGPRVPGPRGGAGRLPPTCHAPFPALRGSRMGTVTRPCTELRGSSRPGAQARALTHTQVPRAETCSQVLNAHVYRCTRAKPTFRYHRCGHTQTEIRRHPQDPSPRC